MQHATIVGSGVIGLTTAACLLDVGLTVHIVSSGPLEETTSWKAAAAWYPSYVDQSARVIRWARHTYRVLARQAALGIPGVVLRETKTLYRSPTTSPPPWATGLPDARPIAEIDLPPPYSHGLRFTAPVVEMPSYLRWLARHVAQRGATFETRRLERLTEVQDHSSSGAMIVNCSGLGARVLVPDDTVYPIRGQIVRVTNPGIRFSVRDEHHPGGRAYVHPRGRDCILGGTADIGTWDTTPDRQSAAAILNRCRTLLPELANATVLEHLVGLRPGRAAVRVERVASRRGQVVHNYGHGGSGITTSWGCAQEVADLVTKAPAD